MKARNMRNAQIVGLIIIVAANVLMWTHLAFGWFTHTMWYDPVVLALLLAFAVIQVRVLVRQRSA